MKEKRSEKSCHIHRTKKKSESPTDIELMTFHTLPWWDAWTTELRRIRGKLGFMYDMRLVNFHKDFWDCYWGQGKQTGQ